MKTPQEIYSCLGVPAVLIPIKKGSKAANKNGWSKLDFQNTQGAAYQKSLLGAPAIGVCLGKQSEGICSIDFDDDLAFEEFLSLNPDLRSALTTKGKRGGNIWLRLSGEYPRTKKLKRGKDDVGEWRAHGGYTIISGRHPEGMEYQTIVDSSPVPITFAEIVWPNGWSIPKVVPSSSSPHLSQSSQYSIPSLYSVPSLYQGAQTLKERDFIAREARRNLEKNPDLSRLYDRYIARSYTPRQGSRNEALIAMVTFLFHTVGRDRLVELVTSFHQTNYDIFLDSLDQHMSEAFSHLEALEADYLDQLSPEECDLVCQLPPKHLEAFRICRDLAHADREESPLGSFFISFNDLAIRLSTSPSQAGRIIEALVSLGMLKVIQKGELYKKGRQAKATRYHWLGM